MFASLLSGWLSTACMEENLPFVAYLENTEEYIRYAQPGKRSTQSPYREPTHALARRLMRIQQRYLPLAEPISRLEEGTLEEGEKRSFRFNAIGPHSDTTPRCYHVFAVAGDDRADLDLTIYVDSNRRKGYDNQTDFYPMIRYFCPDGGTVARIELRMYRGRGPFAFRIFRYDAQDLSPERTYTWW